MGSVSTRDSDPVGSCLCTLVILLPLPSPGCGSSSSWDLAVDPGQALDSTNLIFQPMFCSRKTPREEGKLLRSLPASVHPAPEMCANTVSAPALKATQDAP